MASQTDFTVYLFDIPRKSDVLVGVGYSMAMEGKIGVVAQDIGSWAKIGVEMWKDGGLKKRKEWETKSVEERQKIHETLANVAAAWPENRKKKTLMTNPRKALEKL